MNKAEQLKELRKKLETDAPKLPLAKTAKDIVPGEGNPQAQVMFIGEAAGYNELIQRRPFVGQAGQLLTQSLTEIGLPRQKVYITNVVKTRPPNNRDPSPQEIEAYRPFLDEEINLIQPQIIVTLGRFSLGKFLPDTKISQVHGQPRWVEFAGLKILVLPLYHPAAALRSEAIMRQFKADFAKLPKLLTALTQQPPNKPQPQVAHTQESQKNITQLKFI